MNKIPRTTRPRRVLGRDDSASPVNLQVARSTSGARPAGRPEQGLTPRFVLTALRRWWMVATPVGLLLAAAGGAVVYLLFEPVYEAAAWFKIEERHALSGV